MAEIRRCGIYAITCTRSQGCYVGQTARAFEKRWAEHRNDLKRGRHDNNSLQSIALAHGVNSLKFKILEQCSADELDDRELHWIAKQGTWNAEPSQAEANRRLAGGGKAKKKGRSKSRTKTGAGWYWWLWLCILLVFGPILSTYVQMPLQKLLTGVPYLGALVSGPPVGIGILSAGIILAIMFIPFIASVMRGVS